PQIRYPRGNSGASAWAPRRHSISKLEISGLGLSAGQVRRSSAITTFAVSRLRFEPLISTLQFMSSSAMSATVSARVGSLSPMNCLPNQKPASSFFSSAMVFSWAGPLPSVVRSSVSSCITRIWLSAVRLTSSSTHRAPWRCASRKLSRVFSGAAKAAPRCPITLGRSSFTPSSPLLGCAAVPVAVGATLGILFRDLIADVGAGRLIDDLHRELHLAAVIHADDLDLHLLADLNDVADLLHALRCQFADMHQAVARAEEVHEGAEIHDLHDLAVVDHAGFRLRHDPLDPVDRGRGRGRIDRRHLDRAIVLDVDLGAGLLGDLADHLAAGADHFADLVLRDVDHGDARRVLADAVAGTGQRLGHLAEDVQAAALGLVERDLHDLRGDGRDLDVHLQGGDALVGAGHLEVHVAQVILVAENIR